MEYREIWNKCTVSTVLILPIFENLLGNITTLNNEKYSIYSLFYNCGFKNAYLYTNEDSSGDFLYLLFDKNNLNNTVLFINKPFYGLLDVIINCKYYQRIISRKKEIILVLKIPENFKDDINKIVNSNYSEVSEDYKNLLKIEGKVVKSNDEHINYLILRNIPARIVYRSEKLEKILRDLLDIQGELHKELFEEFNKKIETIKINDDEGK